MGRSDVIRVILKCVLTFVFFMAGLTKLTPAMHAQSFSELDLVFRNDIGPLWQQQVFDRLSLNIEAVLLKRCIGITELITAALLWGPIQLSDLACIIGCCIMAGATATHYLLHENFVLTFVLGLFFLAVFLLRKTGKDSAKKAK